MTTGALPAVRPEPPLGRPAHRRSPRAGGALAIGSLVTLSVAVYALPALVGHPVVPGDDLTQNLPLRELVGRQLAHGHLPVYDPYLWGGAPLLAGWNAGAAYPLTWLFAVLPGTAAWACNLVAAAAVASTGCYAFLRASALGRLASWLGGLVFAFGGAMAAQVPHVGLVIGMSWTPVALLAVLRLTEPFRLGVGARLGWTAALGASAGLVVVSGEPRAVTDALVVLALYALWRLGRLWRLRRVHDGMPPARATIGWSAACTGAGAVLGAGLGAVQLLPGLAAVATSQRAVVTAYLYNAGSLPLRWLTLLGVPNLLGGSGSFGSPAFFAHYNLTEVTGYVGVLPLVAAAGLWGRLRWGRQLPEWVVFEMIALAGIVLALGTGTPAGHLLLHVPLVGGQRLQSRSILVTDLALAVLLAYWVDGHLEGRTEPALARRERLFGSLPALCVVGLVVGALAVGRGFSTWLGAPATSGALGGWLVPFLLAALAALGVVWSPRSWPARRWGVAAAVLVVADLALFALTTVVAVGTGPLAGAPRQPDRAARRVGAVDRIRPLSALHLVGRFAVYDPRLVFPGALSALGVPDANTRARTYSVQGYGSLTNGRYAAATGTHAVSGTGQDVFAPRAARDGVLDELDTEVVLAPSTYFVGVRHASGGALGTRHARAGALETWFSGTPAAVRTVAVRVSAPGAPRIGVRTPSGKILWAKHAAPAGRGTPRAWRAAFPAAVDAVGVVVAPAHAATLDAPVVTLAGGRREVLDGPLQAAMVAPHWSYAGRDGPFALFDDRRALRPLRVLPRPGGSLAGTSVRRLAGAALTPRAAAVTSPHGATVVRAVADTPGWEATWTPARARSRPGAALVLRVKRLGVVQAVDVPPGRGILRWRYVAPQLGLGLAVSAVALVATAACASAAALAAWRARHTRFLRALR